MTIACLQCVRVLLVAAVGVTCSSHLSTLAFLVRRRTIESNVVESLKLFLESKSFLLGFLLDA